MKIILLLLLICTLYIVPSYGGLPSSKYIPFFMQHNLSGKCAVAQATGSSVLVENCDYYHLSSQFNLVKYDDYYRIKNGQDCIYVTGANNGIAFTEACSNNSKFNFEIIDAGNGQYRLRQIISNQCLYSDGYGIYSWGCWADPNMAFSIKYAPCLYGIDSPGNDIANGWLSSVSNCANWCQTTHNTDYFVVASTPTSFDTSANPNCWCKYSVQNLDQWTNRRWVCSTNYNDIVFKNDATSNLYECTHSAYDNENGLNVGTAVQAVDAGSCRNWCTQYSNAVGYAMATTGGYGGSFNPSANPNCWCKSSISSNPSNNYYRRSCAIGYMNFWSSMAGIYN